MYPYFQDKIAGTLLSKKVFSKPKGTCTFATEYKKIKMGILKGIFPKENKEEKKGFLWKKLERIEQLSDIKSQENRLIVLFKHSTRCIVSKVVLKEAEEKFKHLDKQIDFYFIDLLNYRELSSAISESFNVVHESPQLIVVNNGAVVSHSSHYDIVSINLELLLAEIES